MIFLFSAEIAISMRFPESGGSGKFRSGSGMCRSEGGGAM
jgi:hypothetical protein